MRRLFDGEPAKRAQLHDSREAVIELLEAAERLIQRENGYLVGWRRFQGRIDRQVMDALAPLARVVATGVVDKDPPHDLRGHTKEMRAIPPIDPPLIDQSQIRFVDERRRLQGVPHPLASKLARGDAAQLGIHERQQLVEGTVVPATPIVEQRRDVRR